MNVTFVPIPVVVLSKACDLPHGIMQPAEDFLKYTIFK